jgi:hypothetical protein
MHFGYYNWRNDVRQRESPASSAIPTGLCLTALGFKPESRWDSALEFPKGIRAMLAGAETQSSPSFAIRRELGALPSGHGTHYVHFVIDDTN